MRTKLPKTKTTMVSFTLTVAVESKPRTGINEIMNLATEIANDLIRKDREFTFYKTQIHKIELEPTDPQ